MKHYIAIDWGATSGRVIVAHHDGKDIQMDEIHRFPNAIEQHEDQHYYWNFSELIRQTLIGLQKAAQLGLHYESIGVDTWGVDVCFLDENGQLISQPLAYRDPFTVGVPEQFFQHIPAKQLYDKCGIQVMNFNTVFQLYACRLQQFTPFVNAKHILFMPDMINYVLTGRMACEYTILSTSAMMNPRTKQIDEDILRLCGLQRTQFAPLVMPGTELGTILPSIAEQTGLNPDTRVIAVAGHDTGSAVAACPRIIDGKRTAFLSSGTWSLMGVVTDQPIITPQSAALNFTNEGGVQSTTRLLKNITGLWILEQCRKEWKEQSKDYSYPQLVQMAQQTNGNPDYLFNPDEPRFANPASMITEVQGEYTMTDNEIVWTIFHSLAKRYGEVFQMLQSLSPWKIEALYVIGGGVNNKYLLDLTEKAVGVPVIPGTVEATTLGNIIMQKSAI